MAKKKKEEEKKGGGGREGRYRIQEVTNRTKERVQADFAPLVQTIISETVTGFKLDFMLPDWAALMYSISFERQRVSGWTSAVNSGGKLCEILLQNFDTL